MGTDLARVTWTGESHQVRVIAVTPYTGCQTEGGGKSKRPRKGQAKGWQKGWNMQEGRAGTIRSPRGGRPSLESAGSRTTARYMLRARGRGVQGVYCGGQFAKSVFQRSWVVRTRTLRLQGEGEEQQPQRGGGRGRADQLGGAPLDSLRREWMGVRAIKASIVGFARLPPRPSLEQVRRIGAEGREIDEDVIRDFDVNSHEYHNTWSVLELSSCRSCSAHRKNRFSNSLPSYP